jgi:hypothetical protein
LPHAQAALKAWEPWPVLGTTPVLQYWLDQEGTFLPVVRILSPAEDQGLQVGTACSHLSQMASPQRD